MTDVNAKSEIMAFQRSIKTCTYPAEIARRVKLAFKRMSSANCCSSAQIRISATTSASAGTTYGTAS